MELTKDRGSRGRRGGGCGSFLVCLIDKIFRGLFFRLFLNGKEGEEYIGRGGR